MPINELSLKLNNNGNVFLLKVVAIFLTFLPILWGFFSISIFAIDVPYWDQWDIELPPIIEYYQGTLTPLDFLVIHNDHRPIVPLTIIVISHILTGMNTVTENYLSFIIYSCMFFGILFLAKNICRNDFFFWILSIPVSWYLFNPYLLVSFQHGIQIYYSLMMLFLILGIILLERSDGLDYNFFSSILCAIVAFFSFSAGIFTWPVLFMLIVIRKTDQWVKKSLLWFGAGIFTIFLNYIVLGFSKTGIHGTSGYSAYLMTCIHYPLQKVMCFLGAIGSNIIHNNFYAFFSGFLILILLFVLIIHNWSVLNLHDTAKWYALIIFGLLVSLAITITRSGHGDIFGPETMVLFIAEVRHFPGTIIFMPAICYLAATYLAKSLSQINLNDKNGVDSTRFLNVSGNLFFFGSVCIFLCLGIGFHIIPGIGLAFEWNQNQLENQHALKNYQTSADHELEKMYPVADRVRKLAKKMEDHQIGVFRNDWKKPENHPILERLNYFKNIYI